MTLVQTIDQNPSKHVTPNFWDKKYWNSNLRVISNIKV